MMNICSENLRARLAQGRTKPWRKHEKYVGSFKDKSKESKIQGSRARTKLAQAARWGR